MTSSSRLLLHSPTLRSLVAYTVVAMVAAALGAAAMFYRAPGEPRQGVQPTSAGPGHASHEMPAEDQSDPEEGSVYISPARQQLIGVRTAPVVAREVTGAIRATGALAYDETRVTQVHTKIAGWIEELFADFVGKSVQKGQPLFTIYSPDLVSTQNEYLLARKAQDQLGASQFEETRSGAASLLAAARTRLALWDVPAAQVAELERTGEPRKTVTVYAPASGIVLERNAFSGQYLTPETSAFKLADLSTIWAIGQIVESDLAQVRVGQSVTIDRSNVPGSGSVAGRIAFIYPDVDPATRRVRVRVEIPNPGFILKPDTFVTLTIQAASAPSLAVPAEAVIDTGLKQYVILARGRGYFEPRVIQVGAPAGDYYPVISGLAPGDRVVTSAQFLIDSETNLQTAMQAMSGGPATGEASPLDISFRTSSPAHAGENVLEVSLNDEQGRPVTDATVVVTFLMAAMPSMGMPELRTVATLSQVAAGHYRGTGTVPAAGRWDVTVAVTRATDRPARKSVALLVN